MMAGVGLTGVFLWYLVRFWVYGKAVVLTSAPLTIPAGFLIAGMAVATLIGAALASWAAGPISERIEEKNIPVARVVAGACLLYAIGLGLAWGLGVWSTGTARENGMLLFALISGPAPSRPRPRHLCARQLGRSGARRHHRRATGERLRA